MSFSQFLHEAENDIDTTEFGTASETSRKSKPDDDDEIEPDFENAERMHDPSKKQEKDKDSD